MLRSAWILGVGSLLTLWYTGRVLFLSFSRNPGALCRSCDSVARRWSRAILKLAGVSGWLPIDARFAAKKELERIPVFGRAWRACGHISIDRANRASAIESMTRAGLGPFVTAIEGGVPIVPVGLVGSRAIMPKGSFRIRRGAIVVRVGEPISVVGMKHATETAFAIRSGTLSPSCAAEKGGPAAYRENRHWTMFRSHRV